MRFPMGFMSLMLALAAGTAEAAVDPALAFPMAEECSAVAPPIGFEPDDLDGTANEDGPGAAAVAEARPLISAKPETALSLLCRGLTDAIAADNYKVIGSAYRLIGAHAFVKGESARGIRAIERSLSAHRQIDDLEGYAMALNMGGVINAEAGNFAEG
ncbi:MAG: hypothetical protein AAGD40_05260, partial [Pseudomonadota bacterium]